MVNNLASGKGLCSPGCSKVGWKFVDLFGSSLRLKMLVRSESMHTVAGHKDSVLAPFSEDCLGIHLAKIPKQRYRVDLEVRMNLKLETSPCWKSCFGAFGNIKVWLFRLQTAQCHIKKQQASTNYFGWTGGGYSRHMLDVSLGNFSSGSNGDTCESTHP